MKPHTESIGKYSDRKISDKLPNGPASKHRTEVREGRASAWITTPYGFRSICRIFPLHALTASRWLNSWIVDARKTDITKFRGSMYKSNAQLSQKHGSIRSLRTINDFITERVECIVNRCAFPQILRHSMKSFYCAFIVARYQ